MCAHMCVMASWNLRPIHHNHTYRGFIYTAEHWSTSSPLTYHLKHQIKWRVTLYMYPNPRGHQAGCKRHPDIQTLVPEFSHNGMGSHTHCHTSGQRHIGNTCHGRVHSCGDLASAKSSQT